MITRTRTGRFAVTALWAATLAMPFAVGPVSAADDTPTFPDRDRAWIREGTFIRPEALRAMMPGLTHDQVYALIGWPHFSEGVFAVREWNYIVNLRTGVGTEFVTCQYQVRWDEQDGGGWVVRDLHWDRVDCGELLR